MGKGVPTCFPPRRADPAVDSLPGPTEAQIVRRRARAVAFRRAAGRREAPRLSGARRPLPPGHRGSGRCGTRPFACSRSNAPGHAAQAPEWASSHGGLIRRSRPIVLSAWMAVADSRGPKHQESASIVSAPRSAL
jgi:hypothetical protein